MSIYADTPPVEEREYLLPGESAGFASHATHIRFHAAGADVLEWSDPTLRYLRFSWAGGADVDVADPARKREPFEVLNVWDYVANEPRFEWSITGAVELMREVHADAELCATLIESMEYLQSLRLAKIREIRGR